MQLEEQLQRRLDAARESIRSKYKALQSAARPNDLLADEIENELKRLRDSLSHDEIVQVQARVDAVRLDAGPMRPSVVGRSGPTLFADLQDEYHFLQRLLE